MAISSLDHPSSAFRYALLTVKPIPFEEIIKVKGVKFRQKGIRYEPEKQFESYEDYVRFRYKQILSKMPLPESFSYEKLYDHFCEVAVKRFKEDKQLQEELEKKERSLLGFVDFIMRRFENKMTDYYMSEANRFMCSNLPFSFFTQTSMFINTYHKYLSLVRRIVRRYKIKSNMPGVRRRLEQHEKELASMKSVLSPLIDRMDSCCIELQSLKLYVSIWSADKPEEIDAPRFLDVKKLDQTYLTEYNLNYNREHMIIRRMIFQMSKEYDPEIFKKEVTSGNSTAVMLGKLLSSDLE